MGEENKRNMAEQGGTCLGEIQREGVGGNLFEGDAWHKDKEWRAIGESDSTAKREGCCWAVSWEWGVDRLLRCLTGNRKWRQQLCNSCARERGGKRKEGAEQGGGGYTSTPSTLLFPAWVRPSSSVLLWVMFPPQIPNSDALMPTQVLTTWSAAKLIKALIDL